MGDFSSEDRVIKGQIEDLQIDIDRKERELSGFDAEIKGLLRKKELLEAEIEEHYVEMKRLQQELRSLQYD